MADACALRPRRSRIVFSHLTEGVLGKAELGVKLTCESCGAHFYDLNKQPAECPKCGTANTRPKVFKSRKPAVEVREVKPPVPKKTSEANPDGGLGGDIDVEDGDEDVIEDTSGLGEDDTDVDVVVVDDNT